MKWLKISILCRFVTLICEKTGLITRNSTLSDYSSIVRNVGKVLYNFSFDGKKYEGHVWNNNSVFKKGNSWYYTYRDRELYLNW